MSVWERYPKKQRDEYIHFLKVYGALSNLFRQKQGDMIPYLDSKFQETIFARVFQAQNVDIGNTPHDILSVFSDLRVGIGLKTWMHSKPSYQKVMQLKSYKSEIDAALRTDNLLHIATTISMIKNDRMQSDYYRLGLTNGNNIYHYVTRDYGKFVIQECSYTLVDLDNLCDFEKTSTSFSWSDGLKKYKYTYGDSQIFQFFGMNEPETEVVEEFKVDIIDDPFEFLVDSYKNVNFVKEGGNALYQEVFLPLYSYRTKEVEEKSGLNAWNAAPKCKGANTLRPVREIYVPIPKEFHKKCPDFFTDNIFKFEEQQKADVVAGKEKQDLRFNIVLPNGKEIPGLISQSGMKGFQSGSRTEKDENGVYFGQGALGEWLLVEVLGLKERTLVTRKWLEKKGTDSIRLWHKDDDKSKIYIDFAPIGSFEEFMTGENPYEIGEGD
ncbi:NgoFVII family restriction endonuclease [Veillonella sp. VA139]|uniref:NgoFVII family restriction endonuclease n=1 Tax=Veillonella sp. VA139 TaxID=741830 RepID=UPI000F8E7F00|nr:NgoFVII family restriction endonuclease [Veillonella sp. VA139]